MIKSTSLLLVLSLVFASCSSNESETLSTPQQNLLESYTIKRDMNGAYSIDMNTTNYTNVTTVKNNDTSNEVILSEAKQQTANKHTNNFKIENNHLVIGFLDADKGNRKKIIIEDENSNFAKKNVSEFLNSYSVTENNDGTFLLNFKVNNNVSAKFTYNEEIATYEVHLSEGRSQQKEFSEKMTLLSENNPLKIDFVNHKYSAKNQKTATADKRRKPRLIIENGND